MNSKVIKSLGMLFLFGFLIYNLVGAYPSPSDSEMEAQDRAFKEFKESGKECIIEHGYFNHHLKVYSDDNESYQIYRDEEKVPQPFPTYICIGDEEPCDDLRDFDFVGNIELDSRYSGSFYGKNITVVKGNQTHSMIFGCYEYGVISLKSTEKTRGKS